jgi:hypothetical protein
MVPAGKQDKKFQLLIPGKLLLIKKSQVKGQSLKLQ